MQTAGRRKYKRERGLVQRRDHGESLFLLCKTSFSVTSSSPPLLWLLQENSWKCLRPIPFPFVQVLPLPPFPSPSFLREELEVGFRSGFSPGRGGGSSAGFAGCAAFVPRRGAPGVRKAARGAEGCAGSCGGCQRAGGALQGATAPACSPCCCCCGGPGTGGPARSCLAGHAWASDKPRGR